MLQAMKQLLYNWNQHCASLLSNTKGESIQETKGEREEEKEREKRKEKKKNKHYKGASE